QPDAPPDLVVEARMESGAVLAAAGDPRGEALMDAAEDEAAGLGAETLARALRARIASLEARGLCERAAPRVERLRTLMSNVDPSVREQVGHDQWQAERADSPCNQTQERKP
ncbi:MAG: hypothetical protein KDK70_18960, partial [Myxococcales bacterium]|nr:hypothetical protein [Myxococcales bacterium]